MSRKLLLLTLAGLLVRAALLVLEPETRPVADEWTWTRWATSLLDPKVALSPYRTDLIFYPPVYPYFIAVLLDLCGTLTSVKWAQVLAGSLIVPALGRIGARVAGPGAGLLTAGIAAFYPELVWFSIHFWSETLFLVLLWWAFERVLASDASGSAAAAATGGLLWGLAILTRETALYLAPLVAAWMALPRGRLRAASRGAVFLVVALLVVAPWTYRNWVRFHAFVPVSTAGGLNLFQGNTRLSRQEVYDLYHAVPGAIGQYRYAQHMGIQAILERQPAWIFEKLREEMPRFWEADSLVLIHVKRGAYGTVRPAWAAAVAVIVLLPYLVALGFFVWSLATATLDRPRVLFVLFLACYTMLHVATHGFARYRLPVMPVVFLFAAEAVLAWRGGRGAALTLGRGALAMALAVASALVIAPSLRANLHHPAFGLWDAEDAPVEDAP